MLEERVLSCAHLRKRARGRRELQIGGRFTDRVYANNNAAVRSVGIHSSRVRKGYRRTRIGAVKARTSRLGRSLNDSPDNGDKCGHNSPRLRNVQRVRATLLPVLPARQRASTSTFQSLPFYLLFFPEFPSKCKRLLFLPSSKSREKNETNI